MPVTTKVAEKYKGTIISVSHSGTIAIPSLELKVSVELPHNSAHVTHVETVNLTDLAAADLRKSFGVNQNEGLVNGSVYIEYESEKIRDVYRRE